MISFAEAGERFAGGGFPGTPNRSIVTWVGLALVLLWLVGTSLHSIAPGQRGVVTRFGRYSRPSAPASGGRSRRRSTG